MLWCSCKKCYQDHKVVYIKKDIIMLYELTQKSTISIDEYGNTMVLSTESCITPINATKVSDSIVITQSQKDYNYITLGRHSHIQLNHGDRINLR